MQGYQGKHSSQRSVTSRPPMRRNLSLPISRTTSAKDDGSLVTVLKNSLFGLLGFVVSGLMLVTAACAAAYATADPGAFITPLAMAALMSASFAGGFTTAKLVKESPLLCGVVCGAMCAVAMLILSLLFSGAPSSQYTFWQGLLMHSFALLFCILGAFTGNYKRKPNPKKRRFGN